MENWFVSFLLTAVTAMAVENAVFFRVLGLNRYTLSLKSPKAGIIYGGVFTSVAFASSLLVSLVNYLIRDSGYITLIRAPLYFVCATLVYIASYMGTRSFAPRLFEAIKDILPGVSFNTALFGVFFISAMNGYDIFRTIGYALGSGVGYTIAILVVGYARGRIALCPAPRSFRGLPVALVYIGIVSLALYGLIGNGLPI